MNKILFLKIVVTVLTLLIFLTLGGIAYALINYKKTPKLLPRRQEPAVEQVRPQALLPAQETEIPAEIYLDLEKDAKIQDVMPCGALLCLRVASGFARDKIALIDPVSFQIKAWIFADGQK